MAWTYRSQLRYGKYGANICTPVCCVVASKYILNTNKKAHDEDFSEIFSAATMHNIMATCHRLYADCFSERGVNMMLADVQKYFPETVSFCEIAGMTYPQQGPDGGLKRIVDCDDDSKNLLLIQPLFDLISHQLVAGGGGKKAFIITCNDHTISYLFDGKGRVYIFDPLQAHILDVTQTWTNTISGKDVQYSGLILTTTRQLSHD